MIRGLCSRRTDAWTYCPRQPIGLPPRQGDTESDHLDPRDASCVPVFFLGRPDHMADANQLADARHRVRVFIDFWNYTLHMKSVDDPFRTDWSKLGRVLSHATAEVVDPTATGEYQGLNFYGSYNPASETDRKLHRWATGVVDTFPGVRVSIAPRQRKRSPPACPRCHQPLTTCPGCGADMRGTEEKGVDVRMATDMISLAWVDNYDIAVLVSSDRDFVPVAEFLETRGIKVIHGAFPAKGSELTARCWGSINIPHPLVELQRRIHAVAWKAPLAGLQVDLVLRRVAPRASPDLGVVPSGTWDSQGTTRSSGNTCVTPSHRSRVREVGRTVQERLYHETYCCSDGNGSGLEAAARQT